ncbi:MAG: hypothetical protein AAGI37_15780 [Planctomycetota bacterium]
MNASNTPKITLGLGIALALLALVFFGLTGKMTAIIPAYFGVPIVLCGVMAFRDSLRKIAVHAALVIALLSILASLGTIPRMLSGQASALAITEIGLMVGMSATYIALGVRSFINARKERAAQAA